jgi:hypothetical protein
MLKSYVVPANAGTHAEYPELLMYATPLNSAWIPAFAGMTAQKLTTKIRS